MNSIINKEDPEYVTQSENYMKYVVEHTDNVKKAYFKLFKNPNKEFTLNGYTPEEVDEILKCLYNEVEAHDATKYLEFEFTRYRARFNPTKKEEELYKSDPDIERFMVEDYNAAWHHHYTRNPHHPKFWKWVAIKETGIYGNPLRWILLTIPRDISLEMDIVSILHMICDWEAMSIKFGGSTVKWYNTKAKEEREDMNPVTRNKVKELLEYIYNETVLDEVVEEPKS